MSRWLIPTRGDLLLLRKAIREGWDVPAGRRATVIDEVCELMKSEDARLTLAVAGVVLDAAGHNLEVERVARALEQAEKRQD